MTKRILSVILSFTLLFALTACTAEDVINTNNQNKEQGPLQTESSTKGGVQSENNSAVTQTETPKAESQQINSISQITKEKAKSIAFEHAGVKEADVYNLEVEFDRDDGIESYEIEFKSAKVEYEYDIHANTGEILKAEKDGKNNQNKTSTTTMGKTSDEAKNIAYTHAGVTADKVYDLEVELDKDDGVISYEVEFKSERTEYKYDIHAETGEILKSEKDRED